MTDLDPARTRPATPPRDAPRDGLLDVLEDALRAVSRLCAVPTALLALAAFAVNFAPTVPLSGSVVEVSRTSQRTRPVAPFRVTVETPTGAVSADVDGPLGLATQPGDSAVVQTTPVFELARSITVYRDGARLGESGRGAVFAWGVPLFLLAVAAYTLSRFHREDALGLVVAAAFFNVGVVVAAAVVAWRALGP